MKTVTTVALLAVLLLVQIAAYKYWEGYRIEPPHLRRPGQKKRVVLMKTITTVAFFAVLPLVICAYKYWEGYRIEPPHLRRPGQKKRATPPTSSRDRTYHYNPPKFSNCVRLQSILQDVQSHILSSSSTRLLYVVVCQMFYRQMQNPQDISKPSDDIVKDILESSWPTFLPLPERMMNGHLGVIWAGTDKTTSASEIQLNPDLIVALEKAPEGSRLHILLHTILVVTLFHEICQHLMKIMFHSEMIPPGYINGKSGALLEELLVGGAISVVWKDPDHDEGDMDKIQALILDYHGHFRKLAVNNCWDFLTSIKTENLKAFPFALLQVYVQKNGFSRSRLFDAPEDQHLKPPDGPDLPDGMVLSRGLGLRITTGGVNVLS